MVYLRETRSICKIQRSFYIFIYLFLNSRNRSIARVEEQICFSGTRFLRKKRKRKGEKERGKGETGEARSIVEVLVRRRKSVTRRRRKTSETYLHADAIQGRRVGGDG